MTCRKGYSDRKKSEDSKNVLSGLRSAMLVRHSFVRSQYFGETWACIGWIFKIQYFPFPTRHLCCGKLKYSTTILHSFLLLHCHTTWPPSSKLASKRFVTGCISTKTIRWWRGGMMQSLVWCALVVHCICKHNIISLSIVKFQIVFEIFIFHDFCTCSIWKLSYASMRSLSSPKLVQRLSNHCRLIFFYHKSILFSSILSHPLHAYLEAFDLDYTQRSNECLQPICCDGTYSLSDSTILDPTYPL